MGLLRHADRLTDRVRLSFSATQVYDTIAVARDGALLALLPGDATAFETPLDGLGLQVYTVTARRDGLESYPASCTLLAQPPSAPPVTGLSCAGGRLTWSNPMPFDRIAIFRNGEHVTDLDGSAESYDDPAPSSELAVYSVVTELEGFRSPEVNCLDNPLWVLEVGDVQVPLGATRVLVPIYVTTPQPINGLGLHVEVDPERFRAVGDEPERNLLTGPGEAADHVRLTWTNGAAYDAVRIERNGEVVAELPGEAREFTDPAVPEGIFTYKVAGVRGGETSFPRTDFLTTISPPGAFLRGDVTRDGRLNLADPLRALQALFRGGAALPCADAADSNDDGTLDVTDAIYTLSYLFRGGVVIRSPGTRYPWFDPTEDTLACRE